MMYCKKCGTQINDDAMFCKKCGAKQTVILSDDEPKGKPDSEEVNKQEPSNNTYTDETVNFIENELCEDNHKTKIKKMWVLLIAISVPLILIVTFLILWNIGVFGNTLSESDVRIAVSNHMRYAHDVRIKEFIDISMDKSGAQATVIIVYDEDGYDVTYPQSTVSLNAQGVVVSCIFCQSDSGENSDNEEIAEEVNDDITGLYATGRSGKCEYDCFVLTNDGKFKGYTGESVVTYPYWPNTKIEELVPSVDNGTYEINGNKITVQTESFYDCMLTFQKARNSDGKPLLVIVGSNHGTSCDFNSDDINTGYEKVSNEAVYKENIHWQDLDTKPDASFVADYENPSSQNTYSSNGNPNYSNDSSSALTCHRCGRTLTDGETCDCTWCDICNAWMLGHGHEEGEDPVNSSAAHSSNDSASIQNGTSSADDFVPLAPEVLSVAPCINADGDASILLDITISDLSLGEQSPSHYNAGENLTITVNGKKVNHETAWRGGKEWQIQINDINLTDTKIFTVILTNKYGLSTTRKVEFK